MNKCLFVGSKKLGLSCLEKLVEFRPETICAVVTLDDSDDSRSELDGFKKISEHGIPVHVLENKPDLLPFLEKYTPDLVLVCGWYRIIPAALLSMPKQGFVGIHNSMLPKYRGGSPLVWAMINGEREVGISIFRFTPGMDEGPVYTQKSVLIYEANYISDMLEGIEALIPETLKDCYSSILAGDLPPQEQQGTPSYCAQRKPDDGKINWCASQENIYNFIRAQSWPYPGAYSFHGERKITFWKVRKSDQLYYGTPGQIVFGKNGEVMVICGDNHPLLIDKISVDGQEATPGTTLNSLQIRIY